MPIAIVALSFGLITVPAPVPLLITVPLDFTDKSVIVVPDPAVGLINDITAPFLILIKVTVPIAKL